MDDQSMESVVESSQDEDEEEEEEEDDELEESHPPQEPPHPPQEPPDVAAARDRRNTDGEGAKRRKGLDGGPQRERAAGGWCTWVAIAAIGSERAEGLERRALEINWRI